jgi:hypothetical protein
MIKGDPPERFANLIGTYVRMTSHPSSASGIVIDEIYVVDGFWTEDNVEWFVKCINMLPVKNPKYTIALNAGRFLKCINSRLPYESKKVPLGTNRIIPCTLADIRHRRNVLKIKKVMEA